MGKNSKQYSYYINRKGEKVRRVNEVLKVLAKDSLVMWANMLGLKNIKYKDELNRTANIGSYVHEFLEKYFTPGTLAIFDDETMAEFDIDKKSDKREVLNCIESFFYWYDNFIKRRKFDIVFRELTVVGDDLGGTIDLGIRGWKDPNKIIITDYKTSGNIYFSQYLQLCAYVMLYEEVYGPDTIEGIMVIAMDRKKGKPAKAGFIDRSELDPFILCFQCLMDVATGVSVLENNIKSFETKIV